MIQALIAPIAELAGGWLKGKADANAAAANLKLVEAEAKAAILKSEKTSLAEWEKLMAQGAQHSWKDEFFSLILAAPCILAFCGEWGRQIVQDGFVALDAMPDYYRYFLGCAIAASFGLRGASKFWSK
jgi:hypothetical protein